VSSTVAAVFAPGFFGSSTVHTALIVGGIVSVVCGVVGVFTVLRGQSFAGHAFSDLGTTGGSGAFLVGIGPLWGFVIAGVAAAGAMEMIGVQRARGRDLATGIVLGAALGLAALFLYLDTTASSTTGATQTILFGSIFAVPTSTLPLAIALGGGTVAAMLALFRPLLLSSASPDLAAARGVPVRLVGVVFLFALALAAALAAITIGSILATALLIGPAAASLRLARSPGRAILTATMIAVAITWISIVLAYDSFDWSSSGGGWPVSFFVVTLALIVYVLSGVPGLVRSRRGARLSQADTDRSGLAVR
jgi:zinc/manganese transport system permease protein